MKNFAAFLFCGVLAGVFRPRGNGCNHHNHHHYDHDVGNVAANVTYTPSVVTYAPAVTGDR